MWSGAGRADYHNVLAGFLPYLDHKYGLWTRNGWYAYTEVPQFTSFCFSLIVVDQRMSWEDALMYCRGHHTDLTSLLSDTETKLALGKLRPEHVSERVWIGLRFLEDRWMWMTGESLNYTAWAQESDCPQRGRCGAVNKAGVWEDWDCNDKLNFICQ
uniref:C-type lectin domain-containing protein n=1 Tax=Neogobius melanostomus TaxID=47308 RepID=A0A8C6TXY9_9GOBI